MGDDLIELNGVSPIIKLCSDACEQCGLLIRCVWEARNTSFIILTESYSSMLIQAYSQEVDVGWTREKYVSMKTIAIQEFQPSCERSELFAFSCSMHPDKSHCFFVFFYVKRWSFVYNFSKSFLWRNVFISQTFFFLNSFLRKEKNSVTTAPTF